MSKNKLNQQQQRRINANREKLLGSELEHTGLVIANFGSNVEIEDIAGNSIICKKRQHLSSVVPGDQIVWQPADGNTGVVLTVKPRRTVLSRPDARGKLHAVAANVDQMFIVIAPSPAPQQTTVDRYLIAAALQNIQPILVLNKQDLLENTELTEDLIDLLKLYHDLGILTLSTSVHKIPSLTSLHAQLLNKTSVFVGQSGVGKSSLISTLLPEEEIKTGAISETAQLGRHTTTTAKLYHLGDPNTNIIDSPGIREFPLWPLSASELAMGFIEFKPFLQECKFRNCMHNQEIGCALRAAADTGKISNTRLVSYQKILTTMDTSLGRERS